MRLSEHDAILEAAEAERTRRLHSEAQAELDRLTHEVQRAPQINDQLAEALAQAELAGEPLPSGEPIDVEKLRRQVSTLRKRVAVFLEGYQTAVRHQNDVNQNRARAYRGAYLQAAGRILPERRSLRQGRASLLDFSGVSLGSAYAAFVLTNAGSVGGDPRAFGTYLGQLFAMPDPAEIWPKLRDKAIVEHEDLQAERDAA